MKRIEVNFYRLQEVLAADSQTLDYRKLAQQKPLASFRARTRAVLAMHLEHMGFDIARKRPDLAGRSLPVALEFEGEPDRPGRPFLKATHEGKVVGELSVCLHSLDVAPFMGTLYQSNPEIENVPLAFSLNPVHPEDGTTP